MSEGDYLELALYNMQMQYGLQVSLLENLCAMSTEMVCTTQKRWLQTCMCAGSYPKFGSQGNIPMLGNVCC